jgi:CBS domain-containing protein
MQFPAESGGFTMRVDRLMTRQVRTCRPDDTLAVAAHVMWEGDIGCLPVVGEDGRVVSVVTDRDIAMRAHFSGRPLRDTPVSEAMSRRLVTVRSHDDLELVEDQMRMAQVHRVPVVNDAGFLVGIVTLNDLAHHRHGKAVGEGVTPDEVATTLAAISTRRSYASAPRVAA